MKERPILFSGSMVRAILDGRKIMTRRVVKPFPYHDGWKNWAAHGDKKRPCPYGQPGDRLWVRETWGLWDTEPKNGPELAKVFYRATHGDLYNLRHQLWRPSIFMPHWASRITIDVTGVRVELLKQITEHDVSSEGLSDWDIAKSCGVLNAWVDLWDSINGKKYPWKSNPWVWVIEFRRAHET